MKKRLLPIPLILLIPIVLLIVVVVAGVYRFSLDDQEILAKFPNRIQKYDPVVDEVFAIHTLNPWTVLVPETQAFAFIESVDKQNQIAFGSYDAGVERGEVTISTRWLTFIDTHQYLSVMTVSNQGSGVLSYLATFRYDLQRKRMVLVDSALVGDRVAVDDLDYENAQVTLSYRSHGEAQAMAAEPNQVQQQKVTIKADLTLLMHKK